MKFLNHFPETQKTRFIYVDTMKPAPTMAERILKIKLSVLEDGKKQNKPEVALQRADSLDRALNLSGEVRQYRKKGSRHYFLLRDKQGSYYVLRFDADLSNKYALVRESRKSITLTEEESKDLSPRDRRFLINQKESEILKGFISTEEEAHEKEQLQTQEQEELDALKQEVE